MKKEVNVDVYFCGGGRKCFSYKAKSMQDVFDDYFSMIHKDGCMHSVSGFLRAMDKEDLIEWLDDRRTIYRCFVSCHGDPTADGYIMIGVDTILNLTDEEEKLMQEGLL